MIVVVVQEPELESGEATPNQEFGVAGGQVEERLSNRHAGERDNVQAPLEDLRGTLRRRIRGSDSPLRRGSNVMTFIPSVPMLLESGVCLPQARYYRITTE